MWRIAILLGLVLGSGACTKPSPHDLIGGADTEAVDLGKNAAGEACNQQSGGTPGAVAIYCGDWDQPAGHARKGGPAGPDALLSLATTGSWRTGLDYRLECGRPEATILLGDMPAVLMRCTRRIGGWPEVAYAASAEGVVYFANGIVSLLPVLERSIGVLSGRLPAERAQSLPPSRAVAQLIDRLAARAFSVGDVAQYDRLMQLGARANLGEDFAAAAVAYRAALALQQKVLGRDNPNTATATMQLALQESNLGHDEQASNLFAKAERLAPQAADRAAPARLQHDKALDRINHRSLEGEPRRSNLKEALRLLERAEADYATLVPPEALTAPEPRSVSSGAAVEALPSERLMTDPTAQSALIGIIEVRRYRAIAYRDLDQSAEAASAMNSANALAKSNGLMQPLVAARVLRTFARTGTAADAFLLREFVSGSGNRLDASSAAFQSALPLTRPVAVTQLLLAAENVRNGAMGSAIDRCRDAAELLRTLKLGADPALLEPCMQAFSARADRVPSERSRLLAEMFLLSELAQSSVTSRQIAEAAARLATSEQLKDLMHRRQEASRILAEQYQMRETLRAQRRPGSIPFEGKPLDTEEMDRRVARAQTELEESDSALHDKAPNYGQLVQQSIPAAEVLSSLKPGEAFVSIMVGKDGGWTFLLHDGTITVGHSADAAARALTTLVGDIRDSLKVKNESVNDYDTAAAQAIYRATLGTVADSLTGVHSLVVAPTGPLLALPFAILLTGPADPSNLAAADWLIRRFTVAHVPGPANFVALRRAGPSHAAKPWFGFGEFVPVTLTQARRSFPDAKCKDGATSLAGLRRLEGARQDLESARSLFNAPRSDELLGAAFTADAVHRAPLNGYRILHFATHGLMPDDLGGAACLSEPVIVTSSLASAADASGGLLSAPDVIDMKLDADAAVLSACNSVREDRLGGESLSALARAFFYAGARALMATHWPLQDRSGSLTTSTFRHLRDGTGGGLASSLRAAQLEMLASADKSHPYFWGPFAVIGEGGGSGPPAGQASGNGDVSRSGLALR